MSHSKIEDWCSRMLDARNPGPAIRVVIMRGAVDTGWQFSLSRSVDLVELSERMLAQMRDAGYSCNYDLRALDEAGQQVGQLRHQVVRTELAPAGESAGVAIALGAQSAVVETIKAGLASQRDFAGLGLEAIRAAQTSQKEFVALVMRENEHLRTECQRLRDTARDNWEMVNKVQTHELEVMQERVKYEKIGGIVEALANGLMARLFGGSATSEGQAITMKLVEKGLMSIAQDPIKTHKILELMDEPERLAIMEAMRSFTTKPLPKEPEKTSGSAAAAAAARSAANGSAS